MTLYTSKAVAQWFGLTERRIRQLRDEGILEEKQAGLYDLKESTRKYLTYLRNGSLADERARLTKAKREAVEMENGLKREQLHRTEDIEAGLSTVLLNVRGRLLVLPNKLAPALAAMGGDQAAIFDTLENAIREALEELRRFDWVNAREEEDGHGAAHQVPPLRMAAADGGPEEDSLPLLPLPGKRAAPAVEEETGSQP